jgi:hypothetical protein
MHVTMSSSAPALTTVAAAAFIAVFGLLLAGCAPSWSKPGASQADFERDNGACEVEAELAVPGRAKFATLLTQSMEADQHRLEYGNRRDACLRRMG